MVDIIGLAEGVAAEMSKAFELLEMDEGQLLEFLKGQMRAGTRFGGALFALLRGAVFLVPSFILLPKMLGESGIWLALALSELLTTACIAAYAALRR